MILAAACDGPFRGDLQMIDAYRCSERLLTRGVGRLIGKPGACNTPSGRLLNRATNEALADLCSLARMAPAAHRDGIHPNALGEAFPNSFMGVMLPDGHGLAKGREGKSDRYYEALCASGGFDAVMEFLLAQRRADARFEAVRDHDERAALVCAMTALCIVAGTYVAVGDGQGRVYLPPRRFWNVAVFDLMRRSSLAEPAGAAATLIERNVCVSPSPPAAATP